MFLPITGGQWSELTVFSTSEELSVFARMGRINRVYNRCQRTPWTVTINWEIGSVNLITFFIFANWTDLLLFASWVL